MRREELYLADLIDNARAVRGYLDGVTRERWDADGMLRDAVLYRMLLLARSLARYRMASETCTPRLHGGRSALSATWQFTSTSESTGRWSGRSPRKSQQSWKSRDWRSSARSTPNWPGDTRRGPHRSPRPRPYATRVISSDLTGPTAFRQRSHHCRKRTTRLAHHRGRVCRLQNYAAHLRLLPIYR
jgi:hypothetical protein